MRTSIEQRGKQMEFTSHRQHQGQIYDVDRHDMGAGLTPCFRIQCGQCKKYGWRGNLQDLRLPPIAVRQMFSRTGWEVDEKRRDKIRCPDCLDKARRRAGDGELSLLEMAEPERLVVSPMQPAGSTLIRVAQPPMLVTDPTPQPQPELPAMSVNPPPEILEQARDLTMAQYGKATRLLDAHFDTKLGCYEDEWNDERVGKEIGCARASVAKFRHEGGWGAITKFADLDKLRAEITVMRQQIKENTIAQQQLLEGLVRRIDIAEQKRLG